MSAERARHALVDRLVAAAQIRTTAVEEAFRTVPRHLFLPGIGITRAYRDDAIVTKRDASGAPISSSSQPAIMALMLEQLDVQPDHRVLEIGAGTGYNAALLAELVGSAGAVVSLDVDADVAAGARAALARWGRADVRVEVGDGRLGWPAGAPFDRIILTVGAADLAPAWSVQLAACGRLVLPLALGPVQRSIAFARADDGLVSDSILGCGFMPMRGEQVPHAVLPGDVSARYETGVLASPAEIADPLALWLAAHEPGVVRLRSNGPSAYGVVAPHGGAALSFDNAGRLAVDAFGAIEPARRLAKLIADWAAAGRPAGDRLRVRAYPAGVADVAAGTAELALPSARLLLDWT